MNEQLNGFLLSLRIRNLIATREFNTAEANRELQSGDGWLCNHSEYDQKLSNEIDVLFKQASADSVMTQDDIIRLALEHFGAVLKPSDLEVKLAALAVAAEREACAKVCDELRDEDGFEPYGTECAAAIRARTPEL